MENDDAKSPEAMTREELLVMKAGVEEQLAEAKQDLENELPRSGPKVAGLGFSPKREQYDKLERELKIIEKLLDKR